MNLKASTRSFREHPIQCKIHATTPSVDIRVRRNLYSTITIKNLYSGASCDGTGLK